MPIDYEYLATALQKTGGGLADFLRQKYLMREDEARSEREGRRQHQYQRQIFDLQKDFQKETQQRSMTHDKDMAEYQAKITEKLTRLTPELQAKYTKEAKLFDQNLRSFYGSPELMEMFYGGLAPTAPVQNKVSSMGLMAIMQKQSRREPLDEGDMQFVQQLPPQAQLLIAQQESQVREWLKNVELEEKKIEASREQARAMGTYRSDMLDLRTTGEENQKSRDAMSKMLQVIGLYGELDMSPEEMRNVTMMNLAKERGSLKGDALQAYEKQEKTRGERRALLDDLLKSLQSGTTEATPAVNKTNQVTEEPPKSDEMKLGEFSPKERTLLEEQLQEARKTDPKITMDDVIRAYRAYKKK